jgi:hypothetical protein
VHAQRDEFYDSRRASSMIGELNDLIGGAELPMEDCHLCFEDSSLLK